MTTFWSWYITILTIATLVALLWLVFATRKGEPKGGTDKTRWLTAERAFALQAERQAPVATGIAILPKPLKATQGRGKSIDLGRGVVDDPLDRLGLVLIADR